ncbi:MAG: hypothetical protein ACJAS9_003837 [Polaribacter sp.]|jgi:signal transduction histidine kinase
MYIHTRPDPKWMKVKFRYKSLIGLMVIISLLLSAIPIYFFIYYLAMLFNIDGGRILEGQEHYLVFSALSVIVLIVFIISTHLLAFYLVGRFNRWSFKKSIDVFFRNNFPAHWNK